MTVLGKAWANLWTNKGGRLVVEYMEEELQGEGAGSKATRVQQWNLNIEQRIILDRVYNMTV